MKIRGIERGAFPEEVLDRETVRRLVLKFFTSHPRAHITYRMAPYDLNWSLTRVAYAVLEEFRERPLPSWAEQHPWRRQVLRPVVDELLAEGKLVHLDRFKLGRIGLPNN